MEYTDLANPDVLIGFDIDIGTEIAKRLGLQVNFVNTAFSGIFPALSGKKFDMVISGLTIKASRLQAFDMVPFYATGPVFIVKSGNPLHLKTVEDLNGVHGGAQIGTQGLDILNAADQKLKSEGKAGLASVQSFDTLPDVIDQMKIGRVDVDVVDQPTAAYYQKQQSGVIETVPGLLSSQLNGVAVRQDSPDLEVAVTWALLQMYKDGTYDQIWNKWIGE